MPQIEAAIQELLAEISNGSYKGDAEWTKAIMSECTRLAYDTYNYYVYGKKCYMDDTITECLYDMVWYTPMQLDYLPTNRSNIIFGDIHLVLECEWNKDIGEIMYDFQKLVQARAEHRVMIFQSYNSGSTIDIMTSYVESSPNSVKGDKYLFAGFGPQDGEFNFKSFVKA